MFPLSNKLIGQLVKHETLSDINYETLDTLEYVDNLKLSFLHVSRRKGKYMGK